MGKQIKKIRPERPPKNLKICEQCGNGGITKKIQFRCKYCGYVNGIGADQYDVQVTYGGVDR